MRRGYNSQPGRALLFRKRLLTVSRFLLQSMRRRRLAVARHGDWSVADQWSRGSKQVIYPTVPRPNPNPNSNPNSVFNNPKLSSNTNP